MCSTRSPHSCPTGSHTRHRSNSTTAVQMVRVPGPHVDVNVHPTKREVSFLFEDRLVEVVCAALQQALTNTTSR